MRKQFTSMKKLMRNLTVLGMSVCLVTSSFAAGIKAESKGTKITVLATSDVHGRFMPWEYAPDTAQTSGSLTQIATLVKEVRKENPNTILVDAGDSIQDNYVETFKDYDKNPMVVGMNEMKYDVWVMGNHEFNFTQEILKRTIKQFKGKALAGNIYYEDGKRFLPGYEIIKKDGVKVGVIGITTPMITQFEKDSGNLEGLKVNNAVTETKKLIKELKGKVDILVAVVHMGEENENNIPDTGVTDLANACPELDAIVAGHMHQNINSKLINGVLVTEPYKYGQAVSRIDFNVEKVGSSYKVTSKEANTISVKGIESDKSLEEKLQEYHQVLRDKVNVPIGKLVKNDLVGSAEIKGISTVFVESTPLMNLFHEVARYYSKAQVVALCTDNERAQLNVGDIKIKDIAANYTYTGGEITVYEVTGKDLKDYMEWSAGYFNTLKDGDVTVSFNPERRASKYSTDDIFGGVNYKIDLTKEAGKRITDLTFLDGKRITDTTKLTLGMNSYRMEGLQKVGGILEGREFKVIYDSKEVFGEDEGTVRNLTIKYIQGVKKGILEGNLTKNWEIVGIDKTSNAYKVVKELLNTDKLTLEKTEDGKYTNVASINVKGKESLTKAEFTKKLNAAEAAYKKATTDREKEQLSNEIVLIKALNNKYK